jgi:hypothetical protein
VTTRDEALARIIEIAQNMSPSLLPDLDYRALHARSVLAPRWATKEDQWPYGEAAAFIRGVLLAVRDEFPEGHWMKTAWYLEPPETW